MIKLTGKKERLEGQLQKIDEAMAKSDYESKVPEDVRQKNVEKVLSNVGCVKFVKLK